MTEKTLPSVTIEIIPSFHDADPMNVVWHGNYSRYFERAREALFRAFEYGYAEMAASGYLYPIVNLEIKYRRPAKVETPILVTATLKEFENRVVVDYTLKDKATGTRLTTGRTVQLPVLAETGEAQLVAPKILFDKLGVTYPW